MDYGAFLNAIASHERPSPDEIAGRINWGRLAVINPEVACQALKAGDVQTFLAAVPTRQTLMFWLLNARLLRQLGLYEAGLVDAYISHNMNNHQYPLWMLREWFRHAERAKLRTAGDPLPGPGPYRLYRGVAGTGPARCVRGISWTLDQARADWFARRWGFTDPAVYAVTIPERRVLVYVNVRHEQEMLVLLGRADRPRLLDGEEGIP